MSTVKLTSLLVTSLLYLNCLNLSFVSGQEGGTTLITIPQGTLRGTTTEIFAGQNVNRFGKVPYADPPTGNLRFRPPTGRPSWDGEWDATRIGPACPQPGWNVTGILPMLPPDYTLPDVVNEDCLHLNIFTPKMTSEASNYPVMVFIQGGAYVSGTTQNFYDGSILVAMKEVVVVTFNYRLNALGFLCTHDDEAPGNYGALDQIAALEWVNDNIHFFGGDNSSITLFGQSAGAASVGLQMISPRAKGLFHRAIAQSGSAFVPFGFKTLPYDIVKNTRKLAELMSCPTEPSRQLVECLRTRNEYEIATVSSFLEGDEVPFCPIVDGPGGFMPDDPLTLMANGEYSKVPLLTGHTAHENGFTLLTIRGVDEGISREKFEQMIMDRLVLRRIYTEDGPADDAVYHQDIFNAINFRYTPWKNPNDGIALRDSYVKLSVDRGYKAGVYLQAKLVAEDHVPTYFYRFDYISEYSPWPSWTGVPHGEDLLYVFGVPYETDRPRQWTDRDRNVSDTVMSLWTNFAKYGDPTPIGQTVPNCGMKWDIFDTNSSSLFHIDAECAIKDDLDPMSAVFWNEYDPKVSFSASYPDCSYCGTCTNVDRDSSSRP
ncbi:neuroligin-2-like [Ptychodera flava]|uniref:neuroligin-2-like n=1 Tax=Ptychodera flava TaxID=63121 RepID=UPI003969FD6F